MRKITRRIHESSRQVARAIAKTPAYWQSRRDRKRVEGGQSDLPVFSSLPRGSRVQGAPLLTPVIRSSTAASVLLTRHRACDRFAAAWASLDHPAISLGFKEPIMEPILYIVNIESAKGIREASFEEIMAGARRAMARRVRKGAGLRSPKLVQEFLSLKLGTLEHEVFCVAYLDNRQRLIEFVELFRATIDGAGVHPREVVKQALQLNAAAVIFAHPHPSGVAEPSQADELMTRKLREALAFVDIRVLDHLIVAGSDVVGFAERGLL